MIIVSAFIKHLIDEGIDVLVNDNFENSLNAIIMTLSNSYLEEGFKGSNTRPSIMKETLDNMIENYSKLIIREKFINVMN